MPIYRHMNISQVVTVKGRYDHVAKNIKRWISSGVDEIVLVDYNCPQETGYRIAKEYKNTKGLTVVILNEELAGPYFNLSKARNIGSVVAKHDTLFMCDADCWVTGTFIYLTKEKLENQHLDLLVTNLDICKAKPLHKKVESEIPTNWCLDGQCFIKNYLMHTLNGYNEKHTNWGGEAYDLYIRVANKGAKIGTFEKSGMYILSHSDQLRSVYLPTDLLPNPKTYYNSSLGFLKKSRRINRINPGYRFGADKSQSKNITLYKDGQLRTWRPGEED